MRPILFVPTSTWLSGRIVFDGDSNTYGIGAGGATTPYPTAAINYLNSTLGASFTLDQYVNSGTDGEQVSAMLADVSTDVDGYFRAGTVRLKRGAAGNVASILGGTNDLFLGGSTSTLQDNLSTWLAGRRDAGFRVIACTIAPLNEIGTPVDFDSKRLVVNQWLRDHPTLYDALADFASCPEAQDPNNSTYFQADKAHFKNALHQILAEQYWVPAFLRAISQK
jgi:hypothetical protein